MKILVFCPNALDGTAFYRCGGVLNELHKLDPNISITYIGNQFRFSEAKGFDLAFFQRTDNDDYLMAMKAVKDLNIPVVVDYDDYLLEVPKDNKYHSIMSNNDINYEHNVREALKLADTVIVSTDKLKELFSPYNKNIVVIRNAFDNYTFRPKFEVSSNKVVLWRGGATHKPDFDYYGDEVYQLMKSNPDFNFVYWTDVTKRQENLAFYSIFDLIKNLPNFKLMPAVSPIDYFQGLQRLQPSIIMSVNKLCDFNLGKSDIAKLEGFYAGSLCIHDDWQEWNWGVIDNKDKSYLFERGNALIDLVRSEPDKANRIYRSELEYVKRNRLLVQANIKRLEIFKEVIKNEPTF